MREVVARRDQFGLPERTIDPGELEQVAFGPQRSVQRRGGEWAKIEELTLQIEAKDVIIRQEDDIKRQLHCWYCGIRQPYSADSTATACTT